MRKDSQRSCVNRSCIQDIGWQRQNKWRRKDIQRICVKRSCIQDIGWQRQNSGQDRGEKIHKEAALSTPVFRTLGGKLASDGGEGAICFAYRPRFIGTTFNFYCPHLQTAPHERCAKSTFSTCPVKCSS